MVRTSAGLNAAACLLGAGLMLLAPARGWADRPGRGLTGPFEVEFIKLTLDHHLAALRMTELAVGTDPRRIAAGSLERDGVLPTPGFAPTQAKATLNDLKSLARRNNRMQRDEILRLQAFLRDWYGMSYTPRVRSDGRELIDVLEEANRGDQFNHAFYETFSRHHFTLMEPLNGCLTGSELRHVPLHRLCDAIRTSQTSDIDQMRRELERRFGIADYQPFADLQPLETEDGPPRGRHSGNQP